jgi:c-di-GMP-binding flagellar brake protein YcgR
MLYVFIIVLLLLIAGFILLQRSGGVGFPWVEFYVKGKEAGFGFSEINLLRKVAVQTKLKNPTSLFWSERTLDRCIRGVIVRQRSKNLVTSPESVNFLSKLFEFRKRVEFNNPKYTRGISTSRNMVAGQYLKIVLPGAGVYNAKVVENLRKYLAISYPEGNPLPPGFSWRGQKVKIYFWRQEDAGYFFETAILGDYTDKQYPILHIKHSDSLIRAQKRKSIRVGLNQNGFLYRLRSINEANETVQQGGGYRCKIVDISEDGAGIMVGGRAKAGMPVKIQTVLNDQDIVLSGVVKDVTFKEMKNVSILHIEASPPSAAMKNRILSYVYGIFRDEK